MGLLRGALGGSGVPAKVKVIPAGSGAGSEGSEHICGMQSAQVGKEMQTRGAGGDKGDFGGAQSCAPKTRPQRCQSSLEQELSKIFPSQNIPVPQDTAGSELMSFLSILPALYSSRSDNFPVTLKKRGSSTGLCPPQQL